jgi:hypothetical protein
MLRAARGRNFSTWQMELSEASSHIGDNVVAWTFSVGDAQRRKCQWTGAPEAAIRRGRR